MDDCFGLDSATWSRAVSGLTMVGVDFLMDSRVVSGVERVGFFFKVGFTSVCFPFSVAVVLRFLAAGASEGGDSFSSHYLTKRPDNAALKPLLNYSKDDGFVSKKTD